MFSPSACETKIGGYIDSYRERFLGENCDSGKKRDWDQILNYWIIPSFGHLTFSQVNGVVLEDFIKNKLRHKEGNKHGKPLSASRKANVLIPFRAIWDAAVEEKKFVLPDPFAYLRKKKKLLTRSTRPSVVVIRFSEYRRILEKIDTFFKPHTEMQIVTGLIGSEWRACERAM